MKLNKSDKIQKKIKSSKLSLIIINVSWAANQYIKIISEGSCNTEDWRMPAENSALITENKLYFKIYSNIKQLF